jgi:hypothetical protein
VDHAAEQLGALQLHRPLGGDAPQELVQRVAVGEGVVRRLPVRMLVCRAEPGDPKCRGIGERTAEIGRGGPTAYCPRKCGDDRLRIVGEQLPGQFGMALPAPPLAAARHQQVGQFGRGPFAQAHQIERVAPRVLLFAAARSDQLPGDGRQHRRSLLPTDDVEAFACLVNEIQGVAAIGKGAVGDGGQQHRRQLRRRGAARNGGQQGPFGAVAMADACPMPQPPAEQRQRARTADRQRLTIASRRLAVAVARDASQTVEEAEVFFLLRQRRNDIGERGDDRQTDTPPVTMARTKNYRVTYQRAVIGDLAAEAQHRLGEDEADIVLQPLAQPVAPMGLAVHVTRPGIDPNGTVIPQLDWRGRDIIGPEVEGAAAGEVKAGMMPMAGQNPVLDRAAVQRKTEMRATVVEREDTAPVVHDK